MLMLMALTCMLAACGDDGTTELYARERALPDECLVEITAERAQALLADALPTVPIKLVVASRTEHQARRDRVTGIWTVTIAVDELTSRAVAHEAAHVATMDDGRGPFDKPQPQPDLHGDVFVTAYKVMLARMVSASCADAL
jgi:hypothetical protein